MVRPAVTLNARNLLAAFPWAPLSNGGSSRQCTYKLYDAKYKASVVERSNFDPCRLPIRQASRTLGILNSPLPPTNNVAR